jgi:hypothetical protein
MRVGSSGGAAMAGSDGVALMTGGVAQESGKRIQRRSRSRTMSSSCS